VGCACASCRDRACKTQREERTQELHPRHLGIRVDPTSTDSLTHPPSPHICWKFRAFGNNDGDGRLRCMLWCPPTLDLGLQAV
jgi:hypothetical protein